MATLKTVQKKVLSILESEFGKTLTNPDGSISFAYGSTRVDVRVLELEDEIHVSFSGFIGFNSKSTPKVLEWCNEQNHIIHFGAVVHSNFGRGKNMTMVRHQILADFLDPGELTTALYATIAAADGLDDEFIRLFGGKRYSDL